MGIKGAACIAGIYEHPTRHAPDKSLAQLHAEVAKGALEDAGLSKDDIDGYFCAGDAPGLGSLSMVDYLGLKPRHVDSTDVGGSSYLLHVSHAAQAIAMGKGLFYRQIETPIEPAYQDATQTIAANMMAECAVEGVQAFLEKRKPSWRND